MKRKVWPIFAWISGALATLNMTLMGIAVFVDNRFGWFLIPGIIFTIVSASITCVAAAYGDTYEKKPKGWRKERRRAEKEAYVNNLERELGIR